jgi:hypothetical protein
MTTDCAHRRSPDHCAGLLGMMLAAASEVVHRGLVLDLAAAGDNRLGDTTDQRGRLDHVLHRVGDVHGLVGV